jgi:NAD(P)-dependent dehydrogenase (short-subunit alcohol dehydrogenase family)
MLTPDPRWAVWPGKGVISFGATVAEADIVRDIATHTWRTIQVTEAAFPGGWKALPAAKLFEIEYWELEQAKLKKGGSAPVHQGKVAIVTGSAAGIGFACAETLAEQGAKVIGIDLSPEIESQMAAIGGVGIVANLTQDVAVLAAIEGAVRDFGGIDIVVSNAGIFTAGAYLEDLDSSNWDKSMAVNLTSHQKLLKYTIPYLKKGAKDPAVVLVGSRNVNAPGAGAASYSCAKAGLTQLCRVAALEPPGALQHHPSRRRFRHQALDPGKLEALRRALRHDRRGVQDAQPDEDRDQVQGCRPHGRGDGFGLVRKDHRRPDPRRWWKRPGDLNRPRSGSPGQRHPHPDPIRKDHRSRPQPEGSSRYAPHHGRQPKGHPQHPQQEDQGQPNRDQGIGPEGDAPLTPGQREGGPGAAAQEAGLTGGPAKGAGRDRGPGFPIDPSQGEQGAGKAEGGNHQGDRQDPNGRKPSLRFPESEGHCGCCTVMAAAPKPRTISSTQTTTPTTIRIVAMIPQILPALVVPSPAGSIWPAAMALRSALPRTQATIPQIGHSTIPKIPRTKMRVPR